MITTIKTNDYSRIIRYILLDDKLLMCKIITTQEVEEDKLSAVVKSLKRELDEYEIELIRGISFEKEVLFIWPHVIKELKEKYPYVNGWLERARLKLEKNKLF